MYIIGDHTSFYRQSSLRSVHDVYMKDLHLEKHSLYSLPVQNFQNYHCGRQLEKELNAKEPCITSLDICAACWFLR